MTDTGTLDGWWLIRRADGELLDDYTGDQWLWAGNGTDPDWPVIDGDLDLLGPLIELIAERVQVSEWRAGQAGFLTCDHDEHQTVLVDREAGA